jgi:LuxR family maltose regulon positive regulatory protein
MGAFPTIPNVPYVPRARLMRALEEWQRARVILMVAPAGFGKTTTATLWLRDALATAHAPRAAWVALNTTSDAAERFVEQVGAQLAPNLAGVREALQLGRAGELTLEQVWTAVLGEIGKCERRVIVVLDDVHLLESEAVLGLMQALLDEGPENLRLVLLSRSRPKLRFSRVQLAGAMVQLGMEDLAFEHEEFEEFVRTRWRMAGVAADVLDEIEARIRGWPAGLQLIGQALPSTRNVVSSDLAAMTSMADLWEYVEGEILRRMPEKTQTLLVRSSQLPVISAGLCGAVLEWPAEEAEQVLEEAAATNGLIMSYRSGAQVTYRVHPVLQEYLQRRLVSTVTKGERGEQRRRAAEWLAANGEVDQALALLMTGGRSDKREQIADVTCAADIVERMTGPALRQMDLTAIMRWVGQLSGEVILARPRLALDAAWAGRLMERPETRGLTDRAAQALAATASLSEVEVRAMQAELQVLEANCRLFLEGRPIAAEEALQAAFVLKPDAGGLTYAHAHVLNGYLNSGVKRTLEERIRSFRRADAIFDKLGFTRGCIDVHKSEALVRRREGDVAGAIEVGELLIRYAEAHGWMRSDAAIEGVLYHGETLYFTGAVQPALDCLKQAAALLEGMPSRAVTLYQLQLRMQLCRLALGEMIELDIVQDRLAWAQLIGSKGIFFFGNDAYLRMLRDMRMGHAERCRGTIEAMRLSLVDVTSTQAPNIVRPILAAEVFAGSSDVRVEPLLRGFLAALRRNEVRFTELQVRMLLVLHLQNIGREDEAVAELAGVLTLLEDMSCVRMVIDFPEVRLLLMRCDSAAARRLLRAMQTREESIARRPFDLSSTEVRVLKLLSLGYQTPRIAEDLNVSVTTVRSHVRNAYLKLGAHNRVDALRIAQESGVI